MTNRQLSFGVERDVLVDELQFYFDSSFVAQMSGEEWESVEPGSMISRYKANFILRRLDGYGWISVETDYSYVQRVNFSDFPGGIGISKTSRM